MNLENEIRQLKASNHVLTHMLSAVLAQHEAEGLLNVGVMLDAFRTNMLRTVHGSNNSNNVGDNPHMQELLAVEQLYQPVLDQLGHWVHEAKRQGGLDDQSLDAWPKHD